MGQASRAPNLKDATKIEFSDHAMVRLRERLPQGSHYLSMPDSDIRRRVEEGWQNAQRANAVEEWYQLNDNSGLPEMIWVCDLKDVFEVDVVALFRENDRRAGVPVLITVLTSEMVFKKKASNRWATTPEKIGRRELGHQPMKTALANMQVAAPPRIVPSPAPLPPAPPVSAVAPLPVSAAPDEEVVLITWWEVEDADSKVLRTHRLEKKHVSEFVTGLVNGGVDLDDIELWTKREMKVKKVVTVSF